MLVFDVLWIWHLVQGQLRLESEAEEKASAKSKAQ
jgi:hypothetical protein